MGMKEQHVLPVDHAERLDYMRKETFFNDIFDKKGVLDESVIDELNYDCYLLSDEPLDKEKEEYGEGSIVHIIPITCLSNKKNLYLIDWITEQNVLGCFCSVDFLFKLKYNAGDCYRWRRESWIEADKRSLTDTQKVLGSWLFPTKKPTISNLPNLLLRISGEWKGWGNTPIVESEHKRYAKFIKNDAAEDEAFEFYKKMVFPLAPCQYTSRNPFA